MKIIKKGDEPSFLAQYRESNPDDDWKKGFRKNAGREPIAQVQERLTSDQHGLCAYCEIDLKNGEKKALNDFRVEHFYPENPKPQDRRDDGINYALHWNNMLGCCTGGNAPSVVDKDERYTNPDVSCDVDKGNQDWTDLILNPLDDIPNFPLIFEFNEEGIISVDKDNCPANLTQKASKSIELLRLNSDRLIKFRKSTIEKLREEVESFSGNELSDRIKELAYDFLTIDDECDFYQPFFSTIRWYLGPDAEEVLHEVEYCG